MATTKFQPEKGKLAKGDTTGSGEFVIGVVTKIVAKTGVVTLDPADGKGEVTFPQGAVLSKVTKDETKAYALLNTKWAAKNGLAPKPEKAPKVLKEPKLDEDGNPIEAPKLHFTKLPEYVSGAGITPSGNDTIDNGDDVAVLLGQFAKDPDALRAFVSTETGVPADDLKARYAHLNWGMQRMNLGNLVRGARAAVIRKAERAEEQRIKALNAPPKPTAEEKAAALKVKQDAAAAAAKVKADAKLAASEAKKAAANAASQAKKDAAAKVKADKAPTA